MFTPSLVSLLLLTSSTLAAPLGPANALTVQTPIGTAQGTFASGVNRFAVKYASAERWAPSKVATTWQFPNNATDPTVLPLACPQVNMDSSAYSEDCLSMILYVPPGLPPSAPVMVWIHGGSFIVGSATPADSTGANTLNGANLAMNSGSIVAVLQYRLGALGFLSPDGSTNLGAKDVVSALQFLKTNVGSFGGDASKITLAGQSSGANMIRALLAAPSADSLFRSAIIQSDPMNYGFLSTGTQKTLVDSFNGLINCDASDTSCHNSLSLDTIIDAQMNVYSNGQNLDPAAGAAEPIRVVRDGSFITSPLDSTAAFPSVSKPLLISTVKNEAATAIYNGIPNSLPEAAFGAALGSLGTSRANAILTSNFYDATPLADGTVDARTQVEKVGTDQMWKCAGWTFARNWVQNGGQAFVALYTVGTTYPGINLATPICSQSGTICHEGDIEIVFGTVQNPSKAQAALTTEVQARYRTFLQTGNPNAPGLSQWAGATTGDVNPLNFGGVGTISEASCDPSFWGASVPFDYQIFGI